MKKIGLTQRVEHIKSYGEKRDCLDQNWHELLLSLDLLPLPLPNIKLIETVDAYLDALELDGVILTGGNDLVITESDKAAPERDAFEKHLISYCLQKKLPVLGVCRGMQLLNVYFGGALSKVSRHVCKNHTVKLTEGKAIQVNSYHDWGIYKDDLASDFSSLGESKDAVVEYCNHKSLPVTGIMWHPERLNNDQDIGLSIIKDIFL